MSAVGHLIGYMIGSVNMVALFGNFGGDTQFKKMCIIAASALIFTNGVTSWLVTERILIARNHSPSSGSTSDSQRPYTPRPAPLVKKLLSAINTFTSSNKLHKPDLSLTWLISHLFLAFVLFWTPWVRSLHAATVIVALCGVPWAIACWAPFTFMGVEINRLADGAPKLLPNGSAYHSVTTADKDDDDDSDSDIEANSASRPSSRPQSRLSILRQSSTQSHTNSGHTRNSSSGVLRLMHVEDDDSSGQEPSSTGELAGIYLGVLNVYTVLPQFVGTFIAWIVFSILEPSGTAAAGKPSSSIGEESGNGSGSGSGNGKGWLDLKGDKPNAISICLFIGAVCAVAAAEATRRFRKMGC
ncbi:MAG: hypothetical protein Q9227_002466 [Pyrenula ochraceoflavens]